MDTIRRLHLRASPQTGSSKPNLIARTRSFLRNTEERLELTFTKRCRRQILSTAGPSLLCMTFVEDGLRIPLRWSEQYGYMTNRMNHCSWVAVLVLLGMCALQLTASFFVLRPNRFQPSRVKTGAYMLLAQTALQPFLYGQQFDLDFMSRALTLAGGLLFVVWSEKQKAGKVDMLSMTSLANEDSGDKLQLAGRLLLTFLFLFQAMYSEQGGMHSVITAPRISNVISCAILVSLSLMVGVGFKSEWSSFGLTAILGFSAIWMYPFWAVDQRWADIYRYHFFMMLSMMGGMMLLTLHGPGGLSFEGRKKAI